MYDPREYRLGLFYVMAAAIAWSTAGFFTRLIDLDYGSMIAGRGICGALGMLILIIAFEPRDWMDRFRNFGRPDLVYILFYVSGTIAFIASLGQTSIAHNSIIFAALPFIAALLGWIFLKEVPSRYAIGASMVAILGVVIMVGFGSDGRLFGDFLSLLATCIMAMSIIMLRHFRTIAVVPCACIGSLISGLIALPLATDLPHAPTVNLVYLLMFGLLNAAPGLTLFSLGSKRLPAVETALISTLDTPLAPLWVWLAFNEQVPPLTLLGGIVVLAAVIGHVLWSAGRA